MRKKEEALSSDLRAEQMVLLEDGHYLRDQALEICPQNRRGNIRQFHVTSLETLRHLVGAGLGYTLVPALAAGSGRKGLRVYRPFSDHKIVREILLVCLDRYPRLKEIEIPAGYLKSRAPAKTEPV